MIEGHEVKRFDHLMRVSKARSELGLFRPTNLLPIEHPMIGKRLVNIQTGRVHVVEAAHKHWRWGYYIALRLRCGEENNVIYWENISTDEEPILSEIKEARRLYMQF